MARKPSNVATTSTTQEATQDQDQEATQGTQEATQDQEATPTQEATQGDQEATQEATQDQEADQRTQEATQDQEADQGTQGEGEASDQDQRASLVDALNKVVANTHAETGTIPDADKDSLYRAYRSIKSKANQQLGLMDWQATTFAADYPHPRESVSAVFTFVQSIVAGQWKPGKMAPENTPEHVVLAWQVALLDAAREKLATSAGPDLWARMSEVRNADGFSLPENLSGRVAKVLAALDVKTTNADTVGHILSVLEANPGKRFTLAQMRRETQALGSRGAGTVDNRLRDLASYCADQDDASASRSTLRLFEGGARIITDHGVAYWVLAD